MLKKDRQISKTLQWLFDRLYQTYGPRHWWPGDTQFEVIVGAILTQNTAWRNVEKAIANLKRGRFLNPKALYALNRRKLAGLIRPAGYFNIKAARIKAFMKFLFFNYGGSLKKMFRTKTEDLRKELLGVNGIGPETADSILLYAGKRPIFVVDAYTRRILSRHALIDAGASYDEIQSLFMNCLPNQERLFNEYHALLVQLGKALCKAKPDCQNCPLRMASGLGL